MAHSLTNDDLDLISKYSALPNQFKEAVSGLTDGQFNLSRSSGQWTIRQIVHHIVDCEMNYFQYDRYALSNTDRKFVFPDFNADEWSENMLYTNRPIELELRFFSIIREYIAYLCHSLPGPLDRTLKTDEGIFTARQAITHDNGHALHHIKQIIETRRVHGI